MEPLTSVWALEKFIMRKVAKQWYDYARKSLHFVKTIERRRHPAAFTWVSDFDHNGLFMWLGTNGGQFGPGDWSNPAQVGLVVINTSDGLHLPYGKLWDILSRDSSAKNCHTNSNKEAWMSVNLGLALIPSAYTLRHACGYSSSALRNWVFQVSKNGKDWTTIRTHVDDGALSRPGDTHTWTLEPPPDEEGWCHVRIKLTGPNQVAKTLDLCGEW
jgi:E3 ubiquitin-protein ligase HECTD1